MSIYQGFHYDLEKKPHKKHVRQRDNQASMWKRLLLGFGMSICILAVTVVLFFHYHM